MATRYLDKEGLAYFWTKIKAYFTDHTPTALSQLTDDSTHRVVTDTQISTWNAAEPNQNAFSNVKVGSTTVAADGKTDTVELVAGSNITLTPDATNDKITIAVTDTSGEANQNAFSYVKVTPVSGTSTDIAADTKTDTLELKAGSNITLTADAANDKITISATDAPAAATATPVMDGTATVGTSVKYAREDHVHPVDTSRHPLIDSSHKLSADLVDDGTNNKVFTAAEKTKLAGIAEGAEVNQNAFSKVIVGNTEVTADSKTDSLTIIAGSNVTITPNASNDSITIASDNTTYTPASETPLMDGTAAVGTSVKYAREDHVHPTDTSRAASDHVHGNITNAGAITSDTTVANGDKIVITDSSNSNKISRSSIAFDGSDDTVALTKKGTWRAFATLDTNGLVPAEQLPSYVDDIIEVYGRTGSTPLTSSWLSDTSASGSAITPETGKIYVLMEDFSYTEDGETTVYPANSQYRWGGTSYVKLTDGSGVSRITETEIDQITDADIPSLAA